MNKKEKVYCEKIIDYVIGWDDATKYPHLYNLVIDLANEIDGKEKYLKMLEYKENNNE